MPMQAGRLSGRVAATRPAGRGITVYSQRVVAMPQEEEWTG